MTDTRCQLPPNNPIFDLTTLSDGTGLVQGRNGIAPLTCAHEGTAIVIDPDNSDKYFIFWCSNRPENN